MATKLFDLNNKIALVSGASRGIGEEIAKLLAEQGAHVIVSSRKIDDCTAVATGISEAGGSAEAVANMTKVFAKECGAMGIRCNALLPGLTKTKFAGALFSNDEIYAEAVRGIPMGRHAEPSEMAGTVLYLVSDASSYTNGECIVVDGGMTI